MKYLFYFFLLFTLSSYGQVLKINSRPASRMLIFNDAKDLEAWAPDTTSAVNFAVFVKATYGNNQMNNIYIWYKGTPISDSTNSFKAKHWIIQPVNQTRGFWSLPTIPASYHNIVDWQQGLSVAFASYLSQKSANNIYLRKDSIPTIQGAPGINGTNGKDGASITGAQGLPGTPATPNTSGYGVLINNNVIYADTSKLETKIHTASTFQNKGNYQPAGSYESPLTFNSPFTRYGNVVSMPTNYLTANQNITVTGDITGDGATAINTTLKNIGTPGTYTKITTDYAGRVISSGTLLPADIPSLTQYALAGDLTTEKSRAQSTETGLSNRSTADSIRLINEISRSQLAEAGKEPAIPTGTALQYLTGQKQLATLNTTAVPEATNLYYTAARVNAAIAAYLISKPFVLAIGTKATTALIALNATSSVNVVFDKTMPDVNYSTTQILANGTTFVSITNKTTTGCTINFTATVSLAVGSSFSVVAYEQTP